MNAIIISELPCSSWAKNHAANNQVNAIWEGGEHVAPPSSCLWGLPVSPRPLPWGSGSGCKGSRCLGSCTRLQPAVPGMSRAARASGNLAALYFLAKSLPLWPGLTQMTIFLCPSRLSFLGLAGEMEAFEQPRGLRSPPCLAPGSDLPQRQHPELQMCLLG